MIKRIAITGPESTGKTELAKKLAGHFSTVWVPEYAREYIDNLDRPYNYNDILLISKEQLRLEEAAVEHAHRFLFSDSDFTVTKIWCEFKYHRCHPWIREQFRNHVYDLYLLCDIDIPWESDPQREHPQFREQLFKIYTNELTSAQFPFLTVSGLGESRLKNAIRIIEQKLT